MTIASDLMFHAFPQKQSLITRILFPAIESRVSNSNQFKEDSAEIIIENIYLDFRNSNSDWNQFWKILRNAHR